MARPQGPAAASGAGAGPAGNVRPGRGVLGRGSGLRLAFHAGLELRADACRRARGNATFAQVFIESLNTGTATIFLEIGPTHVYPKLREFGIGTPTGVDLEGETRGILNQPGDLVWSENNFLNTSFGQGVAVSPLQMLTAVNAIANDGLIMQPHIVKARIDGNEVIDDFDLTTLATYWEI